MKFPAPRKNHGMAVIFVLIAVTVLSLLAGGFAYSMKVETRLAQNANNDEQLLWLGRAGMERACWILAQEPAGVSTLNQIWAGGPGEGPETNGPLAGIDLKVPFQVGLGTVSLKITELESKINVNRADTPLIQQVLTMMGVDAGSISVVADSIQDWVDADDGTRPAGAESDYYQGQSPAYYAKNAPMDDLAELMLVKGVTPEMYWGGSATNHSGSVFRHQRLGFGNSPGQTPDYPFGLAEVFTPFSSGPININTASETVLQLVPGMDTDTAGRILTLRFGEGSMLLAGSVETMLRAAGASDQVFQQAQRYFSTGGNTYEVHATAQIGDYRREYIGVIFRSGPNAQVVSFHWN